MTPPRAWWAEPETVFESDGVIALSVSCRGYDQLLHLIFFENPTGKFLSRGCVE